MLSRKRAELATDMTDSEGKGTRADGERRREEARREETDLVRTQTQVDAVELERRRGPSLSFSCCLIQPPQTRARTTRAIRQCSAECVHL